MPGFLAAVLAKLAGAGTVTKAIAATTAALTVALGGGAAGVIALSGGQDGPSAAVVQGAARQVTAAVDAANSVPLPTSTGSGVKVTTETTSPTVSTSAPAISTSARAAPSAPPTNRAAAPNVRVPTIPALAPSRAAWPTWFLPVGPCPTRPG